MRSAPKIIFIFLLFLSTGILAQCPQNIGFEDGSFKGWKCYVGSIDRNSRIVSVPYEGEVTGRHSIITKTSAEKDPYGHFPTAPPNGSKYCVRLGNDNNGAEAERLTYTYTIPAGQESTLILNWAVVLENPGHSDDQQPRFSAKIFNVTDSVYINCPSFDFVGNSIPGFKVSDVLPNHDRPAYDVAYREWSATTVNLVGLGGKTIRLEFTTNDCAPGGHFGYAYFDIDEHCGGAISGNIYCNGQQDVTLYAPLGFNHYTWYNAANLSVPIGHESSVKLLQPPPEGTKYAVAIEPYAGIGCQDTLYTTIHKLTEVFRLKVQDTVYGCRYIGADITDASIKAGSSAGLTYSYYTDVGATTYMPTPEFADEGTYYIKGENAGGCLDVKPVHVVLIDPPDVVVTNPRPVAFPATVDISQTFTHKPGLNYSYYTDAAATNPVTDYKAIKHGGTYYVKAVINQFGCSSIRPIIVVINAPKIILTAPNAFTPNNDGINDMFAIKANVDGVLTVKDIKIYNRNGQLVFTAKSLTDYWNGTFNGKVLPTGTYYWVLEGVNSMNNERVLKSAYITLLH